MKIHETVEVTKARERRSLQDRKEMRKKQRLLGSTLLGGSFLMTRCLLLAFLLLLQDRDHILNLQKISTVPSTKAHKSTDRRRRQGTARPVEKMAPLREDPLDCNRGS